MSALAPPRRAMRWNMGWSERNPEDSLGTCPVSRRANIANSPDATGFVSDLPCHHAPRRVRRRNEEGAMSTERNKEMVEYTFKTLFNTGDLSLADELVSDDFLNHDAPPDSPGGPAGL